MPLSILSLFRSVVLVTALCCGLVGYGQGKFTVSGRVKVDGGSLDGARAVVYKNGVKERTITTNLSKFTLDLGLNADYVISFEKDGFVAKKLSFDTHVPAEVMANGFTPFDFAVSIFKQYDDINIVVFNQPVGMIRFDPGVGDFDYDTDYTKSIQSQMQEVLDQVEQKKKEEENASANKAKEEAEAAKQKQRAEEEARKQAATQQAAEAKAKAEADKQAAAKQAELAKADAETRRQAEAAARELEAKEVAAKKEEEKRKAAEAKAEASKPKPVLEKAPKPSSPPPPPPAVPQRNALASKPTAGEDTRRTTAPMAGQDERPAEVVEAPVVNRTEDLIVDAAKVTTLVKLETDGVVTEYRRVYHKWGGTFYFKNGLICTQQVYERETLTPELAGATPRGKLD
ncbi:MAG TPA: hypothetical protein PK760_06160 [Flavobacteriales bacterium]|nr:hypothetical protein [Flavobacteriales bacterium]